MEWYHHYVLNLLNMATDKKDNSVKVMLRLWLFRWQVRLYKYVTVKQLNRLTERKKNN
jgi:hypothetical protein